MNSDGVMVASGNSTSVKFEGKCQLVARISVATESTPTIHKKETTHCFLTCVADQRECDIPFLG